MGDSTKKSPCRLIHSRFKPIKMVRADSAASVMSLIADGTYEQVGTFKPEPKRWVIERTFAWFGRNRRLAKDFERTIESAEAWFLIASIRLLTRRLARA